MLCLLGTTQLKARDLNQSIMIVIIIDVGDQRTRRLGAPHYALAIHIMELVSVPRIASVVVARGQARSIWVDIGRRKRFVIGMMPVPANTHSAKFLQMVPLARGRVLERR